MVEKLRSLEVGPKEPKHKRNNNRKELKVLEKSMAPTIPKSFAKVVAGT